MPQNLLRVEQVSLTAAVGSQQLLQNLSFEVFPGDRIALVGTSGAGKTSLLRLLNRLSEPTSGTIYLENQAYQEISPVQLRQQIPLVMQETKLLGMSVQDAIAYPLQLRGLSAADIKQRMITWMQRLQIPETWLNRSEVQLSMGERQRIAIARALVIQPKILLLDEPTAALDLGRATQIAHILTELATDIPIAIVMATQQLEIARRFCTRLLYLQAGQLITDVVAEQVDWSLLQQQFMQTEAKAAEEWS